MTLLGDGARTLVLGHGRNGHMSTFADQFPGSGGAISHRPAEPEAARGQNESWRRSAERRSVGNDDTSARGLKSDPSGGVAAYPPGNHVFTTGQGVYLIDDGGERYLDGCSGTFNVGLGYGHPAVTTA